MVLAINEDDNVRLKTYEGNMYGSITGVKGTGDLALDRIIISALDNGDQTVRLEKPAAMRAEKTIPKILAGDYPLKFKHKARELFSDKLRDENGHKIIRTNAKITYPEGTKEYHDSTKTENGHKIIRSNAKISCPEGNKEYHASTKTAELSTKQSTTAMKNLSDEFEDAHSPVNESATAAAEQKERERAATAAAQQKERERAATIAAQQKERERAATAAAEQKERERAATVAAQQKERERAATAAAEQKERERAATAAAQQKERERIAEQKREHERAADQQQRGNREQQQQQAEQQIRGYARQHSSNKPPFLTSATAATAATAATRPLAVVLNTVAGDARTAVWT